MACTLIRSRAALVTIRRAGMNPVDALRDTNFAHFYKFPARYKLQEVLKNNVQLQHLRF